MPVTTLNPTENFHFTGHCSPVPWVVTWSRSINQPLFGDRTLELTFDDAYSGVGSASDVFANMILLLYRGNTATLKAVLRVAVGAVSGAKIQINEVAKGDVVFENNDRIDVIRAFEPRDMVVSNTNKFLWDSREAPNGSASNPPPIVNNGGPIANWTVAGSLDVVHYGSTSTRMDPDAGSTTDAWVLPGGTPGTSTALDPSVSYPYGFRFVQHTQTDSNGKTQTTFSPVWAHDPVNYPPLNVKVTARSGSLTQGYYTMSFSVPLYSANDVLALPDRTAICYWEEEERDGVVASYGSDVSGRSNVKFYGYLDSTSIVIDEAGDRVTFTAISALGIMAKTAALSILAIAGTTDDSTHVKSLSVWRALWYMLRRHSSVLTAHDLLLPDGIDYLYSLFTIDNISSAKGQLDDLARSIRVIATSDMLSRIVLRRDFQLMPYSERTGRAKILNFTTREIIKVEITMPHRQTTKLATVDAIRAGTTIETQLPVFSWAPGDVPAEGNQTVALDKQIVPTSDYQAVTDQIAGDFYANANGLFYDETLKTRRLVPKSMRVRVKSSRDVIDVGLGEVVGFILPESSNRRKYAITSDERWVVQSISVSYSDSGVKTTDLVVDHETHMPPGKIKPVKKTNVVLDGPPFTDYNPGGVITPVPYDPAPTGLSGPTGKAFAIDVFYDKAVATVTNGTTWFIVGSGVITGDMKDGCSDTYNYGRKFIITADGLWRVDDPYGTLDLITHLPSTPILVATEDVITGTVNVYPTQIEMSINRKGYMAACFGLHSFAYSVNYGLAWTQISPPGSAVDSTNHAALSDLTSGNPSIAISQRNNPGATNQGWIWMTIFTGGAMTVYLSKNWGATWTLITTIVGQFGAHLHIPYFRDDGTPNINDTNQYVLMYGNGGTLRKITAAGVVTSLTASPPSFRNDGHYGINSYTLDGAILAAASAGTGAIPGVPYVSTSQDGAGSWTNFSHSLGSNGSLPGVTGWSSDPKILVYWGEHTLYVSTDGGVTSVDFSGNLVALIGGSFQIAWAGYDLVDVIPPS